MCNNVRQKLTSISLFWKNINFEVTVDFYNYSWQIFKENTIFINLTILFKFLYYLDPSYVQFFGDDFLRTLILRFVFCDVVLRLHRGFRGRHQRPRCEPPLPAAELLEHPSLAHIVLQLATHLDVRGHFSEGPEGDWCKGTYNLECTRIKLTNFTFIIQFHHFL